MSSESGQGSQMCICAVLCAQARVQDLLSKELPSDPITQVSLYWRLYCLLYIYILYCHDVLPLLCLCSKQKDKMRRQGRREKTALNPQYTHNNNTQALLALYFFLAGMLVKGHAYMWLLPCVSCACAVAFHAVHSLSLNVVGSYR